MKPERKRVTLIGIVGEVQAALYAVLVTRPALWLAQARERARDLPKTNFDLGCRFATQEKWLDALFRFRMAAYFQPEYPQVWYNIGCCYFRLGRLPKAQLALQKALMQQPGQPEALFMLVAIDPEALPPAQRPTRMPASMIDDFFTALAPVYDVEEARNRYQAGKVIHELVAAHLNNAAPVVLDLACGTGIAARPWRATAKEIIGVDSVPAMLAMAEAASHADKKLFDRLVAADVMQLPTDLAKGSADVVQLVNAAHFIGDLSGMLQGASQALAPEGLLVLTVEPHASNTGFGVNASSGRFGHASAYVTQTAMAAGLKLVQEASVQLYPATYSQALIFSKGL